jgi:hypothetical protein
VPVDPLKRIFARLHGKWRISAGKDGKQRVAAENHGYWRKTAENDSIFGQKTMTEAASFALQL